MQTTTRLLHVALRVKHHLSTTHIPPTHRWCRLHTSLPQRTLCAQAEPKRTSPTITETPPKAAVESDAKSVSGAREAKSEGPIPDIRSTSLGIDNPESNDPLRWQKFAWKYAGAVLLFFVSYKTLHWYVDRLEADGKRMREEVEENKEIVREIGVGAKNEGGGRMSGGEGSEPVLMTKAKAAQDERLPPLRIFDPVKDEEVGMVSELEELYVYKIELEGRLRDLRGTEWSEEVGREKKEVEDELKGLEVEIRDLEEKERKKL